MQCHWHPDVETGLSCGSCGRPMCTRCMVQHYVGIRCKECAQVRRLPTVEVAPRYYLLASLASVGLGIVGGLVLFFVNEIGLGFFRSFLLVGIGYVIGEGVSAAVNRKRGRSLQVIAGLGVVLSVVLSALGGVPLGALSIFGLLALAVAVYVAASRVGV